MLHAKQRSTASCSKRSIGLPGCLQHRGFIDRDERFQVGVPTRSFQQLADVCLRGKFPVPNCTCCGCEPELVQLTGATRTRWGHEISSLTESRRGGHHKELPSFHCEHALGLMCFCILCLSPRGRLEQTLDLRVEIPGDHESCLTPVGSDEARHRVVGQVHSISAVVDEDRYRRV